MEDDTKDSNSVHDRLLGLGERSFRKSYYPELQKRIEELERAHEELREYKQHLEDQVRERTAELRRANEQLRLEISERRRAEETLEKNRDRLERINDCLLQLRPDCDSNLNRLTALCGELLGAACAFYYRMQGGLLCSIGRWRASPEDVLAAHLCYDLICDAEDDIVLIANPPGEPIAEAGSNARANPMTTYFGQAVKCEGRPVGGLCVAYRTDFQPSDEDRRILGIIACAIGTEDNRKQAQEALGESQQRLLDIIDFLPDGTFVIDGEGGVIAWNRAMEKLTGIRAADMLGRGGYEYALPFYGEPRPMLIDLVLEPDEELEAKYPNVHRKEAVLSGEVSIPALRGEDAYLLSTASILRDSKGKVVGAIESIRDITRRKRAEEERLQFEQRLRQAQKAESLGRMAGAIAHHFNNMLGAVIGNLELATPSLSPGSNLHRCITEAIKASWRAAEVSRLMLTYLGQTTSKLELIDLSDTMGEALLFVGAALPKKVQFVSDSPSEGVKVLADPVHIKQILTNLILNASEAIGELEGSVTMSIHAVTASDIRESRFFPMDWKPMAKEYACVSVSDTGCGMDAATQEKIFDPFFSTKFTGRGLGLAVVMGLVRSHEGAIALDSRVHGGSSFRLYLRVAERKIIPPGTEAPFVSETVEGRGLVLLAEDEPMVSQMTEFMLKHLGYEVIVAADGVEALDIFRKNRDLVRCVLLDLTMPRLDGWETLAALRALQPYLPVILTSGHDEAKVLQGLHSERPQAFLHKPYQMKDLEKALGAVRKASPGKVTR